ncbi:unnamed protein product [Gordionus sp. m RMFG-2023]
MNQMNIRFAIFLQLWNDRKFYKIFDGRESLREKLKFIEECLKISLEFFLNQGNFQTQISGLYLSYCLYNCQTQTPKLKLRFTLQHMQILPNFIEKLVTQHHHDTLYILYQLFSTGAIDFVFLTDEVHYHSHKKYTDDIDNQNLEDIQMSQTFKPFLENIKDLSTIHEQHFNNTQLIFNNFPEVTSFIHLFNSNFIESYKGIIFDGIKKLEEVNNQVSENKKPKAS